MIPGWWYVLAGFSISLSGHSEQYVFLSMSTRLFIILYTKSRSDIYIYMELIILLFLVTHKEILYFFCARNNMTQRRQNTFIYNTLDYV